jgi:2-polyprenyl-3-methyl-5-hydroxy-6-metoxy-1,4-benzoquinol methylase
MRLHRPRRRQAFQEELDHPWYHDFSALGVPTRQAEGIFGPNQRAKQASLFDYIDKAIALAGPAPTGLELFCADGYYSHYALQRGARHMTGLDLGDEQSAGHPIQLRQAAAMTALLGHEGRADFRRENVFDVSGVYDFAICAGGLYHVSEPEVLLRKLVANVRAVMVVQTVYSLAEQAADYFETPAPGQTWGCRFSYGYLVAMLAEAGWTVLESAINELGGNTRPQDRGSAYALCVPRRADSA